MPGGIKARAQTGGARIDSDTGVVQFLGSSPSGPPDMAPRGWTAANAICVRPADVRSLLVGLVPMALAGGASRSSGRQGDRHLVRD